MLESHPRSALRATRGMQERNTVTAIVRDDDRGLGTDHLREVELDELFVSGQAVAPPARLIREPVAGEVQCADAEPRAEVVGSLKPVDAAGGPAMYEQQHRRVAVADLDVKYLDRGGVLLRWPP